MSTTVMTRALGRSNIQVSAVGMGCWAIGGPFWSAGGTASYGWGEVGDAESIRAIHQALDLGITFFDTAANYGTGHSERILGQALAGRRAEVVIATKFGFDITKVEKQVYGYPNDADVVKNLRADCEANLSRLNTDYIDLYQLHVGGYPLDAAVTVRDVLEELVKEGKIRAYGWSTDSVEAARVFAEGPNCAAIQHDLNVVLDAPEMLALCEQANLASINRTPLARGALTGKYSKDVVFSRDDVRQDQWTRERFFGPTFQHLEALREILTSNGRTLAQGALAWIWARSDKTIPIPGFRTEAQVRENSEAMRFGPLTPDQMQEIEGLLQGAQA